MSSSGGLVVPDPLSPQFSETRGPAIAAAAAVCIFITTVIALLRVYVRKALIRHFGSDDWAFVLSAALVIASCIPFIYNLRNGEGHHIWYFTDDEIGRLMKVASISIVLYQVAMCSLKVTFLLQYRRVFPLPNIQRFCDIFAILIVFWGISQLVVSNISCVPIKNGDTGQNVDTSQCIDQTKWWYSNAIISLITDLVIIAIPLSLLRMIPLKRGAKIVLVGIFCLGFFTCGISIVRITTLAMATQTPDFTWDVTPGLWSIVELTCSLACAGIPTLRPLVTRFSGRMRRLGSCDDMRKRPRTTDLESTTLQASRETRTTPRVMTPSTSVVDWDGLDGGRRTDSAITKDSIIYTLRHSVLATRPSEHYESHDLATQLSPPPRRDTEHSLPEIAPTAVSYSRPLPQR